MKAKYRSQRYIPTVKQTQDTFDCVDWFYGTEAYDNIKLAQQASIKELRAAEQQHIATQNVDWLYFPVAYKEKDLNIQSKNNSNQGKNKSFDASLKNQYADFGFNDMVASQFQNDTGNNYTPEAYEKTKITPNFPWLKKTINQDSKSKRSMSLDYKAQIIFEAHVS